MTISPLQNGFCLAHGPFFFKISAIGFGFLLRYPLNIQAFVAINYIYNTIYTIILHYTILYDTVS